MESLNSPPELSLDFKPTFIPKTISQFLGQVSRIGSVSEKILKLDDFISRLETEMRKIDAFKRELPLCMFLINDAIFALKEESMMLKKSSNAEPVLEEFMPLKNNCDDNAEIETIRKDNSCGDKKNWLSSTHLWNTNDNDPNTRKPNSIKQITKKRAEEEDDPFRTPGRCHGFTMMPKTSDNSRSVHCYEPRARSDIQTATPHQQQSSRKQRRCWSTELHRRFVDALQQLGGSQAATPRQIRELMQVDGLTNDEVKSHLQKYRLHTRRHPSSNTSSANQSGIILGNSLWMSPQDQYIESSKNGISHSGSPDGPLLIGTTTGGDSMDDGEDAKSENYCWKDIF